VAELSDVQKNKIYENFKNRTEKQILMAEGITCTFGKVEIAVKPLFWDQSNTFEDAVIEIIKKVGSQSDLFSTDMVKQMADDNFLGRVDQLLMLVSTLFRDDLVNLANIVTNGAVTIETIRENQATKDEVINIVTTSISVNYSHLKNFLSLASKVM
jgi:hypothetical protein